MFKIRRSLVIVGGSALLGADVNLYRSAANALKTDDGFIVGGTPFVAPYSTTSPTLDVNGQIAVYQKGGTPRLAVRLAGTVINIELPTTTGGTAFYRVASPP